MANKLVNETSPYLLQHASNPVNWYPWGKEAIELAKKENKIILVSIGYSACHWCHVMAHESFEDEVAASLMNRFFINIKIDREERPDIDHIYMDAVQAISGSGGWPLNVFLTPDLKPFYGGTYFPPIPAHGRPSWKEVLISLHDKWLNNPGEILEQAENLFDYLNKISSRPPAIQSSPVNPDLDRVQLIGENLMKTADKINGGFGNAPKFPQTFSINFLLDQYYFFNDENALAHASHSLHKMLQGGIYDQIGGGLARYSTDEAWRVPHFEKMLYDNALLLIVLADAYQVTASRQFANAIDQIIKFCNRELRSPQGGYYAALDADSEGVEGKFYVWTESEIIQLLGEEDGAVFNKIYNISREGNWEGLNIPYLKDDLSSIVKDLGIDDDNFQVKLDNWKQILLDARNKRVRPGLDNKIILGWNALYLKAMVKCALVIPNNNYKLQAIELYEFLAQNLQENGRLIHLQKSGASIIEAFLDDYAYWIEALLDLYTLTGDDNLVMKAGELIEETINKFSDEGGLYFYFTAKDKEDVLVRRLDLYDGAIPSANSVMAKNLIAFGLITDNIELLRRAEKMVNDLQEVILLYPGSFGVWSRLLLQLKFGINHIRLKYNSDKVEEIFNELNYLPNKVIDYYYKAEKMDGYQLCKNSVCHPLLINPEDLKTFIKNLEGKY